MARWKYTLLVLDYMIDQVKANKDFMFTKEGEPEINFVAIAEKLPRLVIPNPEDATQPQKISIQPRICSKLWENLRKCLRESFRMELEFFDQTR
jgi:hypothetical protein